MAHSRLSNPEYKNWVTVGRAIQITSNGLRNIVQNAVDKYHTWLIATLPKNVCKWRNYLTTAHRSCDKKKISWSNSDDTQWLTAGASWEIAKIFMAPLGRRKFDVVNAKATDISGLLNVLEWSPRGPRGIFNTGVDLSKLADVRSARNIWAHAPQLHICDADKAKAFASFTNLFRDQELRHDKDVQDAITKLHQLLNDGLAVIEEKELELLVELQHQLSLDVVSLKSDMSNWKDQVDANLEQIQNLRESLEEFIKTNELQKDIESMKKRIDKVEKQFIQHVQSTNIRLGTLEENASSEPEQFVCDAKPSLKFNPVCDRLKEKFVGREWLFRDIDSWLDKDLGPTESRAFSIRGGPGTGKNSIARELVRRQEGKKLAGYHFFQKDNPRTCDLESLIDNLSRMLSKSLPEYAALVGSYLRDVDKFRDYPVKLFDDLITTPLQQLQGNTKRFLFIGALDEGGPVIASCFAKLSAALPPWFRVIFTARKNATSLFNLFPECTCANLNRVATRSPSKAFRNLEDDMQRFVTMMHKKLQKECLDDIPRFFKNNTRAAIEKIVKVSKDCFLYAKLIMEHIFHGHDTFRPLPSTLSQIYCLDFRRLFPDQTFFETKVAPIIEVAIAIQRVTSKVVKETLPGNSKLSWKAVNSCGTFLETVVEMGLLSGITTRDLTKALQELSVYLFQSSEGIFYFCHSSVVVWLQEKKSDFYCDERNGHATLATFHREMLKTHPPRLEDPEMSLVYYFFHSSYLPEPRSTNINFLKSELGIKATDLLTALCYSTLEHFAMKVIHETNVLGELSLEEKAQHLHLAVISNCERVAAKLIGSAYWIFALDVHRTLTYSRTLTKSLQFAQEKGSLPQLLFSVLCGSPKYYKAIIELCYERGVTADVCVPKFFKNTENFGERICWNQDVQEYFRRLKAGETNIITLESLKENPSFPEEARIDDYTLKIIQEPIPEVERLVKEGECYVCFAYGWHVMALKGSRNGWKDMDKEDIEHLLKFRADVNNQGNLGKTALVMACERQDGDLVSFLLDHGAKVNQQDFYGSTALHHALERKENSEVKPNSSMKVDIIDMLIQHKADPHLKNSRDVSAIDIAEKEGGIVLEKLTGKRRRRGSSEVDQDTSL